MSTALPCHIAVAMRATPLQQQEQQQEQQEQQEQQQQQLAALTRHTKGWFEAEIKRRSGDRRQQVKVIERLIEQQDFSVQAQQQQEQLLAGMQEELSSTTAELQVLRQAVQKSMGASHGKELDVVRRSKEKLEGAKQRAQQNRTDATASRQKQRSTQQQLDALQKRTDKLSTDLTHKAAAATEALKVKAAELEQEQIKARALEKQLMAAATQELDVKQRQRQYKELKHGYRIVNAARKAVQQQAQDLEDQLEAMHAELDFGQACSDEDEGQDDDADFEPDTGAGAQVMTELVYKVYKEKAFSQEVP